MSSISEWNKLHDLITALGKRLTVIEDALKQPEPAEAVTELVRRRGRPPKATEEAHDLN